MGVLVAKRSGHGAAVKSICGGLRSFGSQWSPAFMVVVIVLSAMAGPSPAQQPVALPDYYVVTATAGFRPVSVPGTQRRVAQNDAEAKARRQIHEVVGSMPISRGRTVNDVITRDIRLKAKVLEYIRTAELVDWQVFPACACVQVWVRVDLNAIRAIISACGYR
ncbi:MAG: hypothetical protein ACR2IE_16065 [Candidatus Sumerlaeaceae bacterium]